ncbi:MAG: hypothetical protein ABI400_13975 [Lacisediminihabitans sp.]
MEAELERAAMLARRGQHESELAPAFSFIAPVDAGPIPADLVPRAQHILEAQHEAIERVEVVRRTTGRHLAAMRSVPPHRGDHAVYLDISG